MIKRGIPGTWQGLWIACHSRRLNAWKVSEYRGEGEGV
jgi:hypothetical protein